MATTRLPTQLPAPSPAASTRPSTSMPGVYGSGGLTVRYRPRTPSTSLKLSVAAATRIKSSFGPAAGVGTSSSCSARSGSPCSWTRHALTAGHCGTNRKEPGEPGSLHHFGTRTSGQAAVDGLRGHGRLLRVDARRRLVHELRPARITVQRLLGRLQRLGVLVRAGPSDAAVV